VVVVLSPYLAESTYHFQCVGCHENRFRFHNLCYIDNIAFVMSAAAVMMVMTMNIFRYSKIPLHYALDNHEAGLYI
jgi:hypothetical protein